MAFWNKKTPESLRDQLIKEKKYDELVELCRQQAGEAQQRGDRAAHAQWASVYKQAAAAGGDPYLQVELDRLDPALPVNTVGPYSGSTALIAASFRGEMKLVESLLQRGADVHLTNRSGVNAIISAADENHGEIVRMLARAGADPKSRDHKGQTALHQAAWQNHTDAACALLELGADPAALDDSGFAPLHLAAGKGAVEMVRLLAKAAGVDSRMKGNATALMRAAKAGELAAMQALLDMGANPRLADDEGDTALDYARQYRQEAAAQLLTNARLPNRPAGEDEPAVKAFFEGRRMVVRPVSEAVPDPSTSSLWPLYLEATEVTPPQEYALPGATCQGLQQGPLLNRTLEPMSRYERGIEAFFQLDSGATPADKLLVSAMILNHASLMNMLIFEGVDGPPEKGYQALFEAMGEMTRDVPKPYSLVARWLGGMGGLGIAYGEWEILKSYFVGLKEFSQELASRPGVKAEIEGLFAHMLDRAGNDLATPDAPPAVLSWAAELRAALEADGAICPQGRDLQRRVLGNFGEYPTVADMAEEMCAWAQAQGKQDLFEEWQGHLSKARIAAGEPFCMGQRGDIDSLSEVDQKGQNGRTALMGACARGNSETTSRLLQKGASPNLADDKGWTPLMVAALHDHPEVIRILVAAGADLTARTKSHGDTALSLAVTKGREDAVRSLLELGADPRARDDGGADSYDVAREMGDPAILAVLGLPVEP